MVLAVMILPSIINVSETALRGRAAGSMRRPLWRWAPREMETYFRVSLPAARSGVAAAVVLGVGRAIGEAMAIIMVAGNVPNMPGLFQLGALPHHRHRLSGMSYAAVAACISRRCFPSRWCCFCSSCSSTSLLNVFIKRKKED